jgi:hypothetical protein
MSNISGIPMLNKWYGPYGIYDIPESIMWLANKANNSVGLSEISISPHRKFWHEPAYKIIEEWGNWRDSQEEAA